MLEGGPSVFMRRRRDIWKGYKTPHHNIQNRGGIRNVIICYIRSLCVSIFGEVIIGTFIKLDQLFKEDGRTTSNIKFPPLVETLCMYTIACIPLHVHRCM